MKKTENLRISENKGGGFIRPEAIKKDCIPKGTSFKNDFDSEAQGISDILKLARKCLAFFIENIEKLIEQTNNKRGCQEQEMDDSCQLFTVAES